LEHQSIELIAADPAVALDHTRKAVTLRSGRALGYDDLVLAVGASNRAIDVPGHDLEGVLYLRTLAEAAAIRARLGTPLRVVIIGAGFIGLEAAASLKTLGHDVHVVEMAARPMGRAVSAE